MKAGDLTNGRAARRSAFGDFDAHGSSSRNRWMQRRKLSARSVAPAMFQRSSTNSSMRLA